MSFDRFRIQVAIELDIGCTDLNKWTSYVQKFKDYKVKEANREYLLAELKEDASDIYFKAIFSLADAIFGLYHGRHSWSVIKIYYSVFYLLRCSMACHGYAFLKNKGIYTLKLETGESPVRRDNCTHNGNKVTGDHKTTIATYASMFEQSDILQTNTIDGEVIYDWLMELRNQVNYRERTFQEPNNRHFYSALFDKDKIKSQIETYINDDSYVYCFNEDHCCLAAPLKLALSVRNQLFDFIDFEPLNQNKKEEIEKLIIGTKLDRSTSFNQLYDFGRD